MIRPFRAKAAILRRAGGLERSRLLQDPDRRGTLAIVLNGRRPPPGGSGPCMPAFADIFRDDALAAPAGKTFWPDPRPLVREARAAR